MNRPNFLEDFETVDAHYDHATEYYRDYLIVSQVSGYAYIPTFGGILCVFTQFMNEPSWMESGREYLSVCFIDNAVHFASIFALIITFMYSPDSKLFIIPAVVVVTILILEAFEETSEMIPAAKMVDFYDLLKMCKRKKKQNETAETKKDDDLDEMLRS